ncbi:ssDNA-dependent ATPase [Saccharomycopsis crataegensis]|uniref:SsDNA-dependent ATPase n=1 Tax=Saccharomycopsis crataegensis TaxID=43959 RepID=A0AAV5QNF2_9ASCO|nr:ssDNA-dependent ATPase [Saccharomycopsis crataegensis]
MIKVERSPGSVKIEDVDCLESELMPMGEKDLVKLQYESKLSLAQRLRPKSLKDYIGQLQLVGPDGSVAHYFQDDNIDKIRSMILWGPPGVGKTSLAKIILNESSLKAYEFSAAIDSINQIKSVVDKIDRHRGASKIILFVDEIHRFSRAQQDYLLDLLDRNLVILIGATTENPSFNIIKPLVSRCIVLTLSAHSVSQIKQVLDRGVIELNKTRKYVQDFPEIDLDSSALEFLAKKSNGDLRNSLKLLELCFLLLTDFDPITKKVITHEGSVTVSSQMLREKLDAYGGNRSLINYDAKGDNHYDTISAYHKAVRGSDVNGALYYMMRMLKGGDDPLYVCRRIVRIASEDIGVRDNSCLVYCANVYETVLRLGMPKCLKLMVECTMRVAKSLKSVEIYRAWHLAKDLVKKHPNITVPFHLRDSQSKLYNRLTDGEDGHENNKFVYKYNLDYKDGQVNQQYLPDELTDARVLLKRHLGTKIDTDFDQLDDNDDSEAEFADDDFYGKKRKLNQ